MEVRDDQTVFVIDDEESVRDSIAALVEIRGLPVETFATAEDFLQRYKNDTAGCVVTDLRIERGMTGIELQEVLSSAGSEIPVVVISAYASVSNAVQAMNNGAVTLLEKNCTTDELWSAIVEALKRDTECREKKCDDESLLERFSSLKPDEIEVMTRIVGGMLNKVIAHEMKISLRTVETRRHNILEKTRSDSVADLVRAYVQLETLLGRRPEDVLRSEAPLADHIN
jgi:two-component system response regulator FixJ